MIYVFHKKIDDICFRVRAIQKCYEQINNVNLKIRLIKEYQELKTKIVTIKSLVKLMDNSCSEQWSLSKLLYEKCSRCENEIIKNKYLFST